jgi:O-antigen biosynthesis protein WbqP
MYRRFIKRTFDFLLSLLSIILFSWLIFLLMLAVKITSKGPIFFRQKRVGNHKRLFNILKFRTMQIDTPKDMPTHLLHNSDQYITSVGRFLRKTSLDELPQLFNILLGQMSIVGPRPALWNQDDLIAERDKYGANDIRPGLTGLAQVSGRDELPIPVKAQYDGEYIKKMSLIFDIRCIIKTILCVISHEGVRECGTGVLQQEAAVTKEEE